MRTGIWSASARSLQRVRAKTRKLGLIDHISRFNTKLGYREGWVLSTRFELSLDNLSSKVTTFKNRQDAHKQKDWDSIHYI